LSQGSCRNRDTENKNIYINQQVNDGFPGGF